MSRMDASIIMAGRQPNIINALAQGQEARARADQYQSQNALRQMYQTHGPQIMAGDPAAMNVLARHDPGAAVQIQGQHQIQAQRRQVQARLTAEERRSAEAHVARMDAAERAATAERVQTGLKAAYGAQTPQQWDAIVTQFGAQELVGEFENKQAHARRYMEFAQILQAEQPPEPADEYQRYVAEETEAGRTPLSRIEYAQAKKGGGFSVTTPDGTTVSYGGGQQGPGFGKKATNEIEGRILDSGAMLGRLNDTRALFKPEYLEFETRIGAKIGQWMDKAGKATPEQQELVANFAQFKTEAFNNLNTSLKELSGAAVTPQEAERLLEQLPSVGTGIFDGDSPAEFQAKLEQSIVQQQRAVARYNLWLATGRQGKPWDMGSLDDVDQMINARGAEIEGQLKASGITDPEVLKRQVSMQLRKEVGF